MIRTKGSWMNKALEVRPLEKSVYTAQTALPNGWKKDLKYTWITQVHQV